MNTDAHEDDGFPVAEPDPFTGGRTVAERETGAYKARAYEDGGRFHLVWTDYVVNVRGRLDDCPGPVPHSRRRSVTR